MKSDLMLYHIQKLTQNRSKDQTQELKLYNSERKKWKLLRHWIWQDFSGMTTKAEITKVHRLHQIKIFCAKNTNRIKKQPTEWKEIFSKMYLLCGNIRIRKELLQLNNNKNNPIKKPCIDISKKISESKSISCSVIPNSLQPHELQSTRPLCP